MKGLEESLRENGIYVTTTKGNSMNPMLVEGRDKVVIVPPVFPLKRYDIPVYRRGDHYTMHRIVRVKKNGYIICGDNRITLERDIKDKDIIGVLEGFYQGGKYISCDDAQYLKYAKKVCRKLPLKILKTLPTRAIRKLKRMVKKNAG